MSLDCAAGRVGSGGSASTPTGGGLSMQQQKPGMCEQLFDPAASLTFSFFTYHSQPSHVMSQYVDDYSEHDDRVASPKSAVRGT